MSQSDNFFQAICENSASAIAVINKDGRLSYINKSFEKLSGFSKRDVLDKKFLSDFFNDQQKSDINKLISKVIQRPDEDSATQPREYNFIDRNQNQYHIILRLSKIPEQHLVIAIISDINQIRKLQDYYSLRKQQDYISDIASGIGHEIRNPLSAINTSVEILEDSIKLSGQNKELMNIILEETGHLNEIIREFLRFAKLPEPKFESMNVNSVIEELIKRSTDDLPSNIHINIDLDPSLPSIQGDHDQIYQAFSNVFFNAVEALPNGGDIVIKTSQTTDVYHEDQVEIDFADSGSGIDSDEIKNVFRPFSSNKENKMGMGLTISERIIHTHGGQITIESKSGKGTHVIINLPCNMPRRSLK